LINAPGAKGVWFAKNSAASLLSFFLDSNHIGLQRPEKCFLEKILSCDGADVIGLINEW
jgi:hypothetical protein